MEPTYAASRSENVEAIRSIPSTDSEELRRPKLRSDKVEPKCVQSRIDTVEPSRAKLRRDKAEPKTAASNRDREKTFAIREMPTIESDDPRRT